MKQYLAILLTLTVLIGLISSAPTQKGCFCVTWNQSSCRDAFEYGFKIAEEALKGCFCISWNQSSCGK